VSRVRAAAIYARISADQDGRGLGVKRQVEDCRKLAASRGWVVRGEYVDNDVSAYSGKRRPEYQRMVADLRDGLVDAVIVYNLDRLTRRPVELEEFIAVCEQASVRDVATVTADIDLGTDDGLFMARIFAAFGAKESGRRSARVKRKMEQNAQAGLPHGGSTRPFGYADDMVTIVPAEAAIVRSLVKRFLAGESLRSLATWLDETGVKTVTGQPWRTSTLRTMLASGRIAGLRELRGEVVADAQWKPIITARQRDQILTLMASRKVSGRRSPRRYLLSGMLRCGKCGTRLYSSARRATRRYVCLNGPDHHGCGRLTITAQPVEELITDAVLLRLDTPELADALAGRAASDEHSAALAEQVADDKARLEELAAAYGNRYLTMPELLAARAPIEARIRDGERLLAHASGTSELTELAGAGKRLRRQWSTLNLARQAAIVAAVLDHAVIDAGLRRGSRFDIERVRPVWRV
jgi:DNA invertase Pin-like site-specific DNA recombinase